MRGSAAFRASVAPGGVLAGPWAKNDLWRKAKAVPSLDLRFADSKSLADAVTGQSPVTFTRASSGTYIGSDGLIKTAATNEARFDHNPATGESLGLLVEEQRTNLLLHNRTLTNAAWVATNITAAKDQTGADGVSNSASSITASAGNATILQTITSASAARSTSAYVKRITGTGTVQMTQDNGTTWTAVTVTSSWSRVTIPSATVTNPVVGFRVVTSGDAIAVDYVQLESAAVSTSAIETTTAAVTRSADVASITGTAFSSWYRQDEGTFFVRGATCEATNNPILMQVDDSTNNERIQLRRIGASNVASFFVVDNNVTQAAPSAATFAANTYQNAAAFYQANNFNISLAGTLGVFDTSGTLPTVDRLIIGNTSSTGGIMPNACISRIAYWPQCFSAANLQAITR